jgi:hypothetical protein
MVAVTDSPRHAVPIHFDGEDYNWSDLQTANLSCFYAADSDADVLADRRVPHGDIDMTVTDLGAGRRRSGHDGRSGNDGDHRMAYEAPHVKLLRSDPGSSGEPQVCSVRTLLEKV